MEAATHTRPIPSVQAVPAAEPSAGARVRQVAADYLELTKPRVQSLLLWTTVTTMLVAGSPSLELIFFTCLGGALSTGSAGAINHFIDRDIDLQMERTATRPIPAGRVSPAAALTYGILLGVASVVVLVLAVNTLAAVLATSGLLGYVFVYTLWLKRRTPQNIVIGGAAGAVPPLVGWAAVTGSLSLTAWLLFAIVFMWTPPHFWALSVLIKDDYAASAVPMLPVVRGVKSTTTHILVYSILLLLTTLIPVATGAFGAIYGVTALLLGGLFIYRAVQLTRDDARPVVLKTYLYSLTYLALLFVAMVVDTSV
ncbi:MAG: protoheme IX farnesyltransferase [Thermoleophilaceae bacterium]|nr:protoheme IX farnesyltransferase [Thermoleophilaceae bacterium]